MIKSRAPLRLGLAGGGTDVSPYCDLYGGYVLNATIAKYAYCTIDRLSSNELIFSSYDLCLESIEALSPSIKLNGQLDLHKATYNFFIRNYNFEIPLPLRITTFCDVHPGSGLGSSSTIVVAMVVAFKELLNLPIDDYEVAKIAYQIERIDCCLSGGRQDQYSAAFGGFNFMEFYGDNQVIINPLRIKESVSFELESSLLLFYSGVSRDSALVINDQEKNIRSGLEKALEGLHELKNEATLMKESLLKGNFEGIVNSFNKGWENKKKSSSRVTTAIMEEIYDAGMRSGALSCKVSGAGGGGYMIFFVPLDRRMSLIEALSGYDGIVSSCHFTHYGAQAWRL